MASSVMFQMYSGPPVIISGDDPLITKELSESTVKSITVVKEPCVFFDSPNNGGDFTMYREGINQPFPKRPPGWIIKSLRMIKGGIHSSQVTLYPHPFFKGDGESFQHETFHLQDKYSSLKVDEGAVIFFDDENYKGGGKILLKGDEVQNYTAVKLTSIGKSMKTAREMWPQ